MFTCSITPFLNLTKLSHIFLKFIFTGMFLFLHLFRRFWDVWSQFQETAVCSSYFNGSSRDSWSVWIKIWELIWSTFGTKMPVNTKIFDRLWNACLAESWIVCSVWVSLLFSIDTLFYVYSVYEVGGHHASVSDH